MNPQLEQMGLSLALRSQKERIRDVRPHDIGPATHAWPRRYRDRLYSDRECFTRRRSSPSEPREHSVLKVHSRLLRDARSAFTYRELYHRELLIPMAEPSNSSNSSPASSPGGASSEQFRS